MMNAQQFDMWLCYKFDLLAIKYWLPMLANRNIVEAMK